MEGSLGRGDDLTHPLSQIPGYATGNLSVTDRQTDIHRQLAFHAFLLLIRGILISPSHVLA